MYTNINKLYIVQVFARLQMNFWINKIITLSYNIISIIFQKEIGLHGLKGIGQWANKIWENFFCFWKEFQRNYFVKHWYILFFINIWVVRINVIIHTLKFTMEKIKLNITFVKPNLIWISMIYNIYFLAY